MTGDDDLIPVEDSEAYDVPEGDVAPARRRGVWWGEVLGAIVLGLLIVVAIAGISVYVLSGTDWGHERVRRVALDILRKEARGGKVQVGSVSGNLLTGITVNDLVITDSAGKPFVAVPRLSGEYKIRDIIARRVWIDNIVLERPLIVLDRGPLTGWNWDRIFPRDTTPSNPLDDSPGWTERLRFTNAKIIDGTLIVRSPWSPGKRLDPAAADSAVRAALSGDSRLVIERAPGGYQKILRLDSVTTFLPLLRLTEPGYDYSVAEVGSLSMKAYPFRPPGADVRGFRGVLPFNKDSVWWTGVTARLPNTVVKGQGSYAFDSGDLTLRAHADPADFADLRWVYPRMPANARGELDFDLKWREGFEEYIGYNASLTVGEARIRGSMGVTMSDSVTIHHTDLRFSQVDTRLLEQVLEGFQSPRRGTLTGRAKAEGGRNALLIDGDVIFADQRAGTSRIIALGEVGFPDGGLRAENLRLRLMPAQVELARGYLPDLPISGVVTGSAIVTGNTKTELKIMADLDHLDRGERSQVSGRAIVTMNGPPRFHIDALAKPVSLVEVGRFMPAAGLRGTASGPIILRGTLADLDVDANLAVSGGGRIIARAALDLTGTKRYQGNATMTALDLSAISSKAPATALSGRASVNGVGTELATMRTTVAADLSTSRWDSIAVDTATVRATISGGLAQVGRLYVAGGHAVATASGSFGLTRGRSGTLAYNVAIDSLGAFDGWIPGLRGDPTVVAPRPGIVARAMQVARADSAREARETEIERMVTGKPAPILRPKLPPSLRRDVVAGAISARGTIAGNIHDFNLVGVAAGDDVAARGHFAKRFRSHYAWTNARTADARLAVALDADSLMLGGFGLDSVIARVSYDKPGGHADLRVVQDGERDYQVTADYTLSPERSMLRVADLRLRLDTALWRAARPATISWGGPGIEVGTLDLRNRGTGRIYADGLLPTEGVSNFQLAVENFPVGNLSDLLQSDLQLQGMIHLSGAMSGTLRNPTFRGAFGLAAGEYQGTSLPDLRGRFGYSDQQLVTSIEALRNGGVPMATAEGRIPINLALSGVTGPRLLDAPMAMDILGDSLPVELIPHFTDVVSNVSGQVAGRIALRGRLQRPSVTGGLLITNTAFTINASGMHVEQVNGEVRMTGDVITLGTGTQPIEGVASGPVRVRGTINVGDFRAPEFDIVAWGEHARVLDNKYGEVRADLGLALRGPLASPYLSGQVTITDGVIRAPEPTGKRIIGAGDPALFHVLDTALVSERELYELASPVLRNMRVEVAVAVNRDTWVRTRDANVEIYTDYPVRVNIDRGAYNLTGVVSTERGEYTFLSKRFAVSRGSAMFIGSTDINPTLQITGQYQVQAGSGAAMDVKVLIGGTLRRPRLALESDAQPPRSQSELLSLLAFGQSTTTLGTVQAATSVGGGTAATLTQGAQFAGKQLAGIALGVAIDQLEASVGGQLGTDYFNITPADVPVELTSDDKGLASFIQSTRFEGGKYLNPRTFVVGQMVGLGIPGARVQYRASRGLRYELSAEQRLLLNQPTLSEQTFTRRQGFGAFVIRQWKF